MHRKAGIKLAHGLDLPRASCTLLGMASWEVSESLFPVPIVMQGKEKEREGVTILFTHSLLGGLCVLILGCGYHCGGCFEAPLPLLHILLRVEQDDIGFGYIEHAEGH